MPNNEEMIQPTLEALMAMGPDETDDEDDEMMRTINSNRRCAEEES